MIHPAELIRRKRDGQRLAPEEISELILGYARGEIPDGDPGWIMDREA